MFSGSPSAAVSPRISTLELELEDDVVRTSVLIVVDPEPVGDVRIEVVVIRAGARLLARIGVHDQDDVALVPGLVASEHEEVRNVGWGIEGDERRLAVTRGQSGSRPRPASDREHESARAGHEQREDRQLSSHSRFSSLRGDSRRGVVRHRPLVRFAEPTAAANRSRLVHLTHLSDEALVALLERGQEDALAELYDRYGQVAYSPRVPDAPERDARGGRGAGGVSHRVEERGEVRPRAREGEHVVADDRPPPRGRPRAAGGAAPDRAVHRRVGAGRRRGIGRGRRVAATASGSASRRLSAASRTSSARRWSSRTTAASPSRSWRRGSASPWVLSRAGCSPGSRGCASFSATFASRKEHGDPRQSTT